MGSDNLGPIYSDNFKKWFGDWQNDPQNSSKVVDSNGVPLPVYHGTVMKGKDGLPFKTFRTESDAGEGVMFADNYSVASFFSGHGEARFGNFEEKFEQWPHKDTMDGLVSFLNNVLKNGKYKIMHNEGEYNGEHYEFYRLEHEYDGGTSSSAPLGDTKEEAYENLMYEVKQEIRYMERDSKHAYTGGVYKVYLNIKRPYIFDAKGSPFHMLKTEFHQKRMTVFDLVYFVKQTGQYDGVIVKNVRETTMGNGILTTDYIVFNSNQIKHALDNNGNFNPDMDDMTENKLRNYTKESIRDVLLEGAETRNMKLAKHYLYQNKGFNEQQAMQCIGQIKTDIPNSRLAKCKFMLAMVRMFCDGQLNDGEIIMNLNKSLKYAASEAHVNEYNNDLNGMTAQQVVEKFAGNATDDLNQDKEEVGSQEYNEGSSHYKIVKINSFEEASEYQDYVSWCVTQYEDMFNSYTNNGNGVFYFCLRDGWQDETEEKGEGCPLDSYGLSMIAVSVNPDGSCNTITCRWNHDNGGNDNIMTTKQLSSIIGQNFYSVFKPLTPEEIRANKEQKLYEIQEEIENRCYYDNIEDFTDKREYNPDYNDTVDVDVYVYNSDNGSVIIDEDGQFIIDYVFDGVNNRVGDTMTVYNGNKSSLVTLFKNEYGGVSGKIISDTWFDKALNTFHKGYGSVCMNKKWNLIDKNGQYLLKEWHDSVSSKDSNSNFVNVIDDGKFYYINIKTGDYVFDKSIDRIFYTPDNNLLLKFDGNNYYQIYDTNTLKLKAPWQISELGGTYNTRNGTFYRVKLTDGNSYNLDYYGNLFDTETNEIIYMNPMSSNTNESINKRIKSPIRECIRKMLIETLTKSYTGRLGNKNNSFWDKIEELGFKHRLTKSEYDGDWNWNLRLYIINKNQLNKDVLGKLQQYLNFYNFVIVNKIEGENTIQYWFESRYGDEISTEYHGIWYHATPSNKVDKILKIGLTPRDEGKRGDYRTPRIYLLPFYDDFFFESLYYKDGEISNDFDYTVLKIDLSKMPNPPKLYRDEMAKSHSGVYTYDNIPPQCISVPPQKKKIEEEERQRVFKFISNSIASKYNLKMNNGILSGIFNVPDKGYSVEVKLTFIYKGYTKRFNGDWNVNGFKTRFIQNGETRKNLRTFEFGKGYTGPNEKSNVAKPIENVVKDIDKWLGNEFKVTTPKNKQVENLIRECIHEALKEELDEVRYIDTKYEKYNGKVQKNNWTDEYNQEPIKNGEKIRVFHGCELQTACQIAIEGTSGRTYHPRQYSYESGMNPLGIFVTTDFEVAKKFGASNTGMCIIEFTADANDLESPVWNGQGTYFGQGTNPMPFNNADERNNQKMQYRKDAQNLEDDYYYVNGKKHDLSMSHIRNSDKPELANSIFRNNEHQALFMGDLNPNMIKRIWVNLPGDNGYVHTSNAYRPMSVREFLKAFGNKEWTDYDYGRNRKYKIKKTRLFDPAENVSSFNDLIDRLYSKEKNYFKTREEAAQCLKDQGMLQSPPSDYAYDTIKYELWPRQIIQLYGKDYFNKNFNKLGQ
jgi:hypothetical protein